MPSRGVRVRRIQVVSIAEARGVEGLDGVAADGAVEDEFGHHAAQRYRR